MENLTQKEAFGITAACDRFALHCAAQLSSDYMVAYRERVLRDFRLSIVTFTFVSQEYIQLCI